MGEGSGEGRGVEGLGERKGGGICPVSECGGWGRGDSNAACDERVIMRDPVGVSMC